MESFYYLWRGASRKEEDRHQFRKGENLVDGSGSLQGIKKRATYLVTRFLVVGKQSLFPRLC